MSAKYRLSRGGFRKNVLQADWMVDAMKEHADRGLAFAEATAPRDTSHYADSFKVTIRKNGGIKHNRAEARLVNTDPAALAIEFGHFAGGSRDDAPVPLRSSGRFVEGHHTMTRAIDAM